MVVDGQDLSNGERLLTEIFVSVVIYSVSVAPNAT